MHPADSPCPHHDPAITQEQAQVAWVEQSQVVMVAVDGAAGTAVGTSTTSGPIRSRWEPMWPTRATWWPSTAGARDSAAASASTPCKKHGDWAFERCSSTWW